MGERRGCGQSGSEGRNVQLSVFVLDVGGGFNVNIKDTNHASIPCSHTMLEFDLPKACQRHAKQTQEGANGDAPCVAKKHLWTRIIVVILAAILLREPLL